MYDYYLWYQLEWKPVTCCAAPFLHYPDTAFYVRYVLICASQVDVRSSRHRIDQWFQWGKIPVHTDGCNSEPTLKIVCEYFLERIKYLRNRAVRKMVNCSEHDFPRQSEKERYLVHKTNVCRQVDILVEFHKLLGQPYKVPYNTCSRPRRPLAEAN